MKKIILASNSPRRRDLMKLLEVPFEIIGSEYVEVLENPESPRRTVELFSYHKAEDVARKFTDAIIIGADTVVVLGDQILGKPVDEKDAVRLLNMLSGTEHSIITGFTVLDAASGKSITESIESKVKMKKLTAREIDSYIATGEPMDKAGAYAVQERGGLFVEEIRGDFFNIVGLPLKDLKKALSKFGVHV